MEDLLVQSRFRNLQLWGLLAGRTVAEVCRDGGLNQVEFGALLNLKQSPKVWKRDSWRAKKSDRNPCDLVFSVSAQRIAAYFKMLPEDLFPDSLYSLSLPDYVERTYDSVELLPLLAAGGERYALPPAQFEASQTSEIADVIERQLETIRPREALVLRLRTGLEDGTEHSYEEIGEILAVTPSRANQIEKNALRKMRHPSRSRVLRPFADVPGGEE